MGWTSCLVRSQLSMINFWNHLVNLENNRLPKRILLYNISNTNRCNNWFTELNKLKQISIAENLTLISINQCRIEFSNNQSISWNNNRYQKIKLRYYNLFKSDLKPEPYLLTNLSKSQRSVYAQFRSGILPLAIETGRFSNVSLNNRTCIVCNSEAIEDEYHFLCICPGYETERKLLYIKVAEKFSEFRNLDNFDRFMLLNTDECQKYTAIYVHNAFKLRKESMYQ